MPVRENSIGESRPFRYRNSPMAVGKEKAIILSNPHQAGVNSIMSARLHSTVFAFRLILFPILFLWGCGAFAASPSPEAAPNPGFLAALKHYDQRVEHFARDNEARRAVVLLGDSITEGFNVQRYFPGRNVLNRGIGSDTIGLEPREKDRRGVLHRLDVSVFDCCTSHVFLMIGINDLGDGRSPERMVEGVREIVLTIRAKAPGVTIHLQSILPTAGRFTHHNPNIRKYNAGLRELAAALQCPFHDLHAHCVDERGELRADWTRDGLHLLPDAYGFWQTEINKAMNWSNGP